MQHINIDNYRAVWIPGGLPRKSRFTGRNGGQILERKAGRAEDCRPASLDEVRWAEDEQAGLLPGLPSTVLALTLIWIVLRASLKLGGLYSLDTDSDGLEGLTSRIPYFRDLGITYLHIVKDWALASKAGPSTYDEEDDAAGLGSSHALQQVARELHGAGIRLAVDFGRSRLHLPTKTACMLNWLAHQILSIRLCHKIGNALPTKAILKLLRSSGSFKTTT